MLRKFFSIIALLFFIAGFSSYAHCKSKKKYTPLLQSIMSSKRLDFSKFDIFIDALGGQKTPVIIEGGKLNKGNQRQQKEIRGR